MTIKTLTISMLLAASLLLLTGCGDKDTSEVATEQNSMLQTNTNTGETSDEDGGTNNGDSTIGTGGTITHIETSETGDGNTVISKENDGNSTTLPTVALASLKLIIEKTTLNKDENTTVKVVATYSDNSTKEVTDNVEWVIIPSDAVKMTNTILTALQDKATTVKAKLDTVTSDAVSLNITWIVNGYALPPEPDKTTNDSTLLGIDINDNGVRDDVERWIYNRYKDDHPIMVPLRMQASRAYQKIIIDPSKARETDKIVDDSQNCEWVFTSLSANYFGRKPLVLIESEDSIKEDKEMLYIQYNTTQRARAYGLYNQTLSGGVYGDDGPEDSWIENCDFNTTKYIEMSEKL